MSALLELRALEVRVDGRALLGPVDLSLHAGQCLGLVGESGSGKSLAVLALLGLLPPGLSATGTLRFGPRALALGSREHRALRGRSLAWMPQDPQASLHPLRSIGAQLIESLRILRKLDAAPARREALALFERLQLPDPPALLARFPHQLSGGQRQRVLLALALAGAPELLLADEPTSALDPRLARESLDLLDRLRRELGLALLLVSHDLPLVAAYAQRVAILRRGALVEHGEAAAVFARPQHAYTRELLAAAGKIRGKGKGASKVRADGLAAAPAEDLVGLIEQLTEQMHAAAGELQFELAARLRDEVGELKKELRQMQSAGHA